MNEWLKLLPPFDINALNEIEQQKLFLIFLQDSPSAAYREIKRVIARGFSPLGEVLIEMLCDKGAEGEVMVKPWELKGQLRVVWGLIKQGRVN